MIERYENRENGSFYESEHTENLYVLKFGGSSLVSGDLAQKDIVEYVKHYQKQGNVLVVVSALKGVTEQLHALWEGNGNEELVRVRHARFIDEIPVSLLAKMELQDELEPLFSSLGSDLLLPRTLESRDAVIGYGERISARIVAGILRYDFLPSEAIDASGIFVTDDSFGEARPYFEQTNTIDVTRVLMEKKVPVITGFIGATREGKPTTLGRNSSDLTAALLGEVLHAKEVIIVKDVPGLYDANQVVISEISPQEVFHIKGGTKVVHPQALERMEFASHAIHIKPSSDPASRGTVIYQASQVILEGV